MALLRAILVLSRPFYLPTIWSNCLAGWWLGGAGNTERMPLLLAGVTLVYLGAVFLNDAFDADSDRELNPGRPIPSGLVSRQGVWRVSLFFLIAGALLLLMLGRPAGPLGLFLVFIVILFNGVHRVVPAAPVLLGICRLLLCLLGASVATRGITGVAIWSGLALAFYATGADFFRHYRDQPGKARYWPVLLLLPPIVLALLLNGPGYREAALLLSLVLALWILRGMRESFWSPGRDFAATARTLTAGILIVDWLAVAHGPRELSFIFIGLFGLCFGLLTWTNLRKAAG